MTKETTTTTTTTTTPKTRFKTIPKTFFEVIKMLLATDIAEGDLKIVVLKESGKYGHCKLLVTGEDENGPYKDFLNFTFKPGERYMTGFAQDQIKNEAYEIAEDMQFIYGISDYDCTQDFYNFKNWNIFNGVV